MKQSRLMQKVKRFMAGVVALAMTVTMFPAASATAAEPQEKYPYTLFAASDAEGAITITGNACVNGNIATNGTTVFTGNTINRNGTITEQVNENVIDISAMLDELYFAGKNVTNLTENYVSEEVNCNVSSPTVVQGTMEVKGNVNLNASVKVSEDITIEADSLNANNAVLYSENRDIFISGNNVNFTGLLYAPEGDVTITAQHVNLNSIIVIADTVTLETGNANINYNPNMAEIIGANSGKETTEPDIEATVLFLLGKFNAENQSVDMEWYTNAAEADVTVWTSTDNVAYEQEATVTGVTTYQYVITEEFETRYFKASVTDEQGNTVETAPFVVAKTENGYFVSPLDSDKDGIADEYELLAGTDVNNPDTDGDTLTDYEELYISHTDATKYDSVTEGLSDAEADSDGDRLSNREEIEYATDVQNPDTDNDTLTDYEEIVVYNTDPLKADTDGDTLKDGDEIALGLDPLNPKTFGVPDAEYMVEQTISADSEALEEINTDENEYRLAVDVTASGYVEGNLTAKETGYATAIQNEFMVGIASELSYTNEDGIESVTLTFELDDEVIEDSLGLFPGVEELSGIKRFNVFKYFEELNMLLPIETVVDEENNRIYATTDELGTYCVMDMELWLASFDVPEGVYMDTPATFSLRADATTDEFDVEEMLFGFSGTPEEVTEIEEIVPFTEAEQEVPMLFALNRPTNVTPIDVAFLLQSSGQLPDTFTTQKAMLVNLLGALSEEFGEGNVRFTVINYNLYGAEVLETETGTTWFVNDSDLYSVLDTIEYQYTYDYTDRGNAFETLQKEVEFKENAAKFIFQVMNGSTGVGYQYFDQINTCTKLGINYSELVPEGYFYLDPTYGQQVADAIASTNGMNVTYGSTTPYEVYTHIITYAVPPQVNFEAFVPSGWKKIVLDGILDPKNGVNSDTDDLTDWEEVNTELLSWDTDGTVILPTMKDFIYWVNKPYAEAGVERYLQSKSTQMSPINFDRYVDYVRNSMCILPIHSDPTEADSDGDGLLDGTTQYYQFEEDYVKAIAPLDPEPMSYTGPKNLWINHINEMKNGIVPTDYMEDAAGLEFPVDKEIADFLVALLLKYRDEINEKEDLIRLIAMCIKYISEGSTELGAYLLNFVYDEDYVAYHSQIDTWQRSFGYNDLYDDAFRMGSFMNYGRVDFHVDGINYALWAWKGDYWNLQSGAEVGLYIYNGKVSEVSGQKHYDVVDFEMPMTLSLYNYIDEGTYQNVFNWVPIKEQWWVTGFNPKFTEANPDIMVSIASVDLSEHEKLYNAISNADEIDDYYGDLKCENLIFDETSKTVWIQWYN